MCGSSKTPPRDLGQEMGQTLEAQLKHAPALYEMEATYQPKYAALGVESYDAMMNGVDGESGLLGIYANDITPVMARAAGTASTTQRTADIGDLKTLGPAAVAAIRAANPEQAALMTALNEAAMGDMQEGARLDPGLRREAQQSIRSAQAARGFGLGGNDVAEEVMFTASAADRLRSSRRAFASSVAGLNQATNVDPALAVLGRASTAVNSNLLSQAAAGATGNRAYLFDPQNPYASDLYNTNFNAAAALGIAQSNQKAALIGQGIGAAGSMMGGMMMCWVARAVFGETNPQWRRFRYWLTAVGPRWLCALYMRYGERFAGWIQDKPRVKARVRRWMEARIAELGEETKGGSYGV